ncbi:hypothetical protein KA005_82570 [bacterium]|nr:hypothetical protein [bacterium]
MSIVIESKLENKIFGFITKKRIKKLILVIPKEHLIGLEKIIIVDQIEDKEKREVGGIYRQKYNNKPSSIELGINSIYKRMPRILFFFPFVATFSLSDVLYHEIGHHYHANFTHGIKKKRQEDFVEDYSKRMMKKKFRWWLRFISPLSPLIRYLNKKINLT